MVFGLVYQFLVMLHSAAAYRASMDGRQPLAVLHLALAMVGYLLRRSTSFGDPLFVAAPGESDNPVGGYAFFAYASAVLVVVRLWQIGRSGDKSPGGWRTGLFVWALLGSVYMIFACVDHVGFYRGGGTVVVDAVKLGVRDVRCAGPVIARLDMEREARYRCPNTIVWAPRDAEPFVPWPSYTEAASETLASALRALRPAPNSPAATDSTPKTTVAVDEAISGGD